MFVYLQKLQDLDQHVYFVHTLSALHIDAGLFNDDEKNKLLEDARSGLMAQGIPAEPGPLWRAFVERVRAKLHILLCMSPVGETFRLRCRQLPTLVNCCTIIWLSDWLTEALITLQ